MGDVWRGYDAVLDRPVPVKLIRQQAVLGSPQLQRAGRPGGGRGPARPRRHLRAAAPSRPDDLFIAGDPHQRIYDSKVSLKAVGVRGDGRSTKMRKNYRSTHETSAGRRPCWSDGPSNSSLTTHATRPAGLPLVPARHTARFPRLVCGATRLRRRMPSRSAPCTPSRGWSSGASRSSARASEPSRSPRR